VRLHGQGGEGQFFCADVFLDGPLPILRYIFLCELFIFQDGAKPTYCDVFKSLFSCHYLFKKYTIFDLSLNIGKFILSRLR